MDIGRKIKEARLKAKLTQEQVTEVLGVSRQTISNWENEKTFPDIVSVVKMSDLYAVSLDHLIKEETSMPNYLEYLEDSTNVVKSKKNLSKLILGIAYLVIWSIAIIVFWIFTGESDAMGYGIMYLWIVLPVTTFIISFLIGKNNFWGKWKWMVSIGFGVMYMLGEFATFSAANMLAFGKINSPDFTMIFYGGIVALLGLGVGSLINRLKPKKKAANKKAVLF